MLLLIYAIFVGLFTVYITDKYYKLKEEHKQLEEELSKLKLLNKLKVDYNGDPIIYEEVK